MTRNESKVLSISFIFFAIIDGFLFITHTIDMEQALNLILLFLLVFVTTIYAKRTAEIAKETRTQADASLKMAKETRDARFAALKPIVRIGWIGSKRGEAIDVSFKNIGLGPALNLVCYLTHSGHSFKFKHDKYVAMEVGEKGDILFPTEDFDFMEWDKLAINCDYRSVYGQSFRSALKFNTEEERYLEIVETIGRDDND